MSEEDQTSLYEWFKTTLGEGKVSEVKASKRLVNYPLIIMDHGPASLRRMQRLINPDNVAAESPQSVEINPAHKLVKKLNDIRDAEPALATMIAEQMYDNALIVAGIVDDPRSMVGRLNDILEAAITAKKA